MTAAEVATILAANEGAMRPLEAALSLDPSTYHSAAFHEAELRHAFRPGWVVVGRSDQVAEPGAVLPAVIADERVVVTRARDGELRALSNVCRHRGTTLVEEAATVPSLQCPYHAWTFRLDGALGAAPQMEQSTAFDADDLCLPSFGVWEWAGWVFVNVGEPDARPPDVAGLDALFGEADVTTLVDCAAVDADAPWNWKIVVENFLESYHHRAVHTETLEPTYPAAKSIPIAEPGAAWAALDHETVDGETGHLIVAALYPSLLYAFQPDIGVFWFEIAPNGPDDTSLRIHCLLFPELTEGADEAAAALERVNDEDTVINRRTAEGLRSLVAAPGPLSHLEASNWHFRQWLLGRIAEGEAATATGT